MRIRSITTDASGKAAVQDYCVHDATCVDASTSNRDRTDNRPELARIRRSRHLCGTERRVCHCSSATSVTPSERATSSIRGQSGETSMSGTISDKLSTYQGKFVGPPKNEGLVLCFMPRKKSVPEPNQELAPKKPRRRRTDLSGQVIDVIRAWRETTGMSQAAMGDVLGMSAAAYEKFETREKNECSIDVALRFAKWAKIDIGILLTERRLEPIDDTKKIADAVTRMLAKR